MRNALARRGRRPASAALRSRGHAASAADRIMAGGGASSAPATAVSAARRRPLRPFPPPTSSCNRPRGRRRGHSTFYPKRISTKKDQCEGEKNKKTSRLPRSALARPACRSEAVTVISRGVWSGGAHRLNLSRSFACAGLPTLPLRLAGARLSSVARRPGLIGRRVRSTLCSPSSIPAAGRRGRRANGARRQEGAPSQRRGPRRSWR